MCQVRSPKAVEQNKVYYCKLKFKIQILCTMQDQIKSTEWKYFFRIFFFQICVAFCGLFFNDHLTLIAFSKAVLILFISYRGLLFTRY